MNTLLVCLFAIASAVGPACAAGQVSLGEPPKLPAAAVPQGSEVVAARPAASLSAPALDAPPADAASPVAAAQNADVAVAPLTPQPTKRPHDPAALERVLDKVSQAAAAASRTGKRPIVLFDLDDTLTNSGARVLRILREFLEQPSVRASYPREAAKLEKSLSLSKMRYYYSDTFSEAGVDNPKLLAELQGFWKERFFRNDYIPEDPAIPGAVDFVNEARARGGIVIYLTGRWSAGASGSMEPGTLAGLARDGFPAPDGEDVLLVMKPNDTQPDAEFKEQALADIAGLGEVVGGFENEPANINVFKARFPDGQFVFLDTRTAAAKDPATGRPIDTADGIAWVPDFTRP